MDVQIPPLSQGVRKQGPKLRVGIRGRRCGGLGKEEMVGNCVEDGGEGLNKGAQSPVQPCAARLAQRVVLPREQDRSR